MTTLSPGDLAPAFTLLDAEHHRISLSDFVGRRVIVYFFPAAMTPGCTVQAVDFEAALGDLATGGYQVVGISPDTPEKLARFREAEGLQFPLLSDPDRDVLKAYGAYGLKTLYGKQIEGVLRSTFIIDVDQAGVGTVAVAQYNVKATGHVARLRRELGI